MQEEEERSCFRATPLFLFNEKRLMKHHAATAANIRVRLPTISEVKLCEPQPLGLGV